MNRRPQDYREWYAHHQAVLKYLGMVVADRVKAKQYNINRAIYYLARRAKRIQMHVDAEFDAQTKSAKEECAKRLLMLIARERYRG